MNNLFIYNVLTVALLALTACATIKQSKPMRAIDLFEACITGDFDNREQVAAEQKAGQQVHPLAVHVNRRADTKIKGAPVRDGFWLLEESYYTAPGKDKTEEKPYLFFFEAEGETAVRLWVYQWPKTIAASAVKNANADLVFSFSELTLSPTFKSAVYTLRDGKFYLDAPNDLGNGLKFTLREIIAPGRLEVLELLEKNGQRMTPYDTPIIYVKK